jgi:hypothetical protein
MKEDPGERGTVKTSAILIAEGERTSVYRTVDEVPPGLRGKLARSTSGANAGTVLIADRRGAQELLRANVRALIEQRLERPGLLAFMADGFKQAVRFLRTYGWEFAIPALAALLLWRVLR